MERTVGLVGDTEASRTKRNVPPEEHTTPEMSMFRYVRPTWLGCWIWGGMGLALCWSSDTRRRPGGQKDHRRLSKVFGRASYASMESFKA